MGRSDQTAGNTGPLPPGSPFDQRKIVRRRLLGNWQMATYRALLFDDDSMYALARRGMLGRLRAAAADPSSLPELDK